MTTMNSSGNQISVSDEDGNITADELDSNINDADPGTAIASDDASLEDAAAEVEYVSEGTFCSNFDSCKKNPGHNSFKPVRDFKKEDLPAGFQTEDYWRWVMTKSDLVVKITVCHTSPARAKAHHLYKGKPFPPRNELGTGCVWHIPSSSSYINGPCPCKKCQDSGAPQEKYFELWVTTATHVIFDDSEARMSLFDCFYDSRDREGVRYLYGVDGEFARSFDSYRDVAYVKCVTHDVELVRKLNDLMEEHKTISKRLSPSKSSDGVIISHPHGHSKYITTGKILCCKIPKEPNTPTLEQKFGTGTKCRLPAFPIPDGQHPSSGSLAMRPGQEYSLPEGMTFVLPPRQGFGLKFPYPYDRLSDIWITFPEGTRLIQPNGKDMKELPPQTEFNWMEMDRFLRDYSYYMIHNIPTCSGSSGAFIMCFNKPNQLMHRPHIGGIAKGKGENLNRSAYMKIEA